LAQTTLECKAGFDFRQKPEGGQKCQARRFVNKKILLFLNARVITTSNKVLDG
jgi:hypothetical protein